MRILRPILDFALPPRCAGCGAIVMADYQICAICWASLEFLTGKGCQLCNVPMIDQNLICAPCLASPPLHDGVYAAVTYAGIARDIVVRLKHGRRTGLARLMAMIMKRHVPSSGGLLIPVPLHRWRIWQRGFNQSALLARELTRSLQLDYADNILLRVKATPSLRDMGARDRAKAVQSAFAVPVEARSRVKGKTILLVDDVYTSGATANACARTLKRAGAARVIILCWARVIRDQSLSN